MGDTQSKENVLDVRGTICPYPQLKTKVVLDKLGPGENLKILLDDRESANNIRIVIDQLGDTILETTDEDEEITMLIQKSKRDFKSSLKMKLSE
ncbi:hypothetical protein A3K80_08240 [Candidatus Bathyarchaeota archaeon RBG_13_38_9]|nr:MAG: hypothetical protein A3K80_08240 [Candidatus Bathyarchaeota archaeon RBG_13_38_9]